MLQHTRLVRTVLGTAALALITLTGCQSQRPLFVVMEDGQQSYEQHEYESAATDFQEYVDRKPAHGDAHYWLGRSLLKTGHATEAREHLYQAYALDLGDRDVFEALCDALLATGDHDTLFIMLRQRTLDSKTPRDYALFARCAFKAGDPDEAERAFLTAARIDKGQSAWIQLALSDFYAELGDQKNALERLRMAAYLDPTDDTISDKIVGYGKTPGPTFAIQPKEQLQH